MHKNLQLTPMLINSAELDVKSLAKYSSTSTVSLCDQLRLWRECVNAQTRQSLTARRCGKYQNIMLWPK